VVSIGLSCAISATLLGGTSAPVASNVAHAAGRAVAPPVPKLDASISGPLRARLRSAFDLAVQRVQEVESCSALFVSLRHNGVEMLRNTRYSVAAAAIARDACSKQDIVAFTAVGSPATRVCPSFQQLPPTAAAMILLHEALHYAGLRERPVHPDGLWPAEINALVRKGCGL